MQRMHQSVLIFGVVIGSWLGMQAVHELGHMLGAWVSGGKIARVVLHPLTISRTDYAENPSPLIAVWAGPVVGVLLPLVFWSLAAAWRVRGAFVLRFFAGFCLIANGAYIAGGATSAIGDCGEMLRHGSPLWLLWLFGAITIPTGLWAWNRLGRSFGLSDAGGKVDAPVAYVVLGLTILLASLGFLFGGG